mmetsp:Transcript_6717/g.17978  ORF Transcript_6717/g.17978 Transcript_6717/m.17978 type:complete len:241 (-) Transcript_6717:1306-2028(-)
MPPLIISLSSLRLLLLRVPRMRGGPRLPWSTIWCPGWCRCVHARLCDPGRCAVASWRISARRCSCGCPIGSRGWLTRCERRGGHQGPWWRRHATVGRRRSKRGACSTSIRSRWSCTTACSGQVGLRLYSACRGGGPAAAGMWHAASASAWDARGAWCAPAPAHSSVASASSGRHATRACPFASIWRPHHASCMHRLPRALVVCIWWWHAPMHELLWVGQGHGMVRFTLLVPPLLHGKLMR